jgi:hypothetical protein
MTTPLIRAFIAIICTLGLVAGCSSESSGTGSAAPSDTSLPVIAATSIAADSASPVASSGSASSNGGGTSTKPTNTATTKKSSTSNSGFPSPADCISYNPSNLTVSFDSTKSLYTVSDGSNVVAVAYGNVGGEVGLQALALAQRYTKHCFLGRSNTRDDHATYVFDYWPSPSGKTPTIPDQDNSCNQYNNKNLTVEDMGDNDGWRVKDHDDVLHEFDNQTDANNGKLVLLKYSQACQIGDSGGGSNPVLTYFL